MCDFDSGGLADWDANLSSHIKVITLSMLNVGMPVHRLLVE